ncbi:RICIN domain-containing protein [Streptosporangium sp. NPDC002524]|uniref:RICIN domain-containing protein n=1 Tax=Streptosporangium sp. NPDC002524 TaxID=3154537 RepID=UPI003316DD3C
MSDTTSLQVTGNVSGSWTMRVRIPAWTQGATIGVNGVRQDVVTTPGTYASITRSWTSGDTVTVRLPMRVVLKAANDDPNLRAVTYGPVVLSGDYGNTALSSAPALIPSTITRASTSALAFTATANGAPVNLGPFHDAANHNYVVYWNTSGQGGGGGGASFRLINAASGLALGIQNMSTADGGLALQWTDNGTADHDWVPVVDGNALRFRNVNSGKVLGVENMSTADNARILQWGDTGTADHRWTVADAGDGSVRIRNANSSKVLGILNGSTANGAQAVQDPDNGSADNRWRFVPNGARRVQNVATGMVLGVTGMSTADGALVVQWGDTGTADHLWTAVVDTGGYLRLRNSHSQKVLGVENAATAAGSRVLQWADNGTADHRWRLRYGSDAAFRVQCANGGRVLGLAGIAQGAQIVLADDNGSNDNLWRFL